MRMIPEHLDIFLRELNVEHGIGELRNHTLPPLPCILMAMSEGLMPCSIYAMNSSLPTVRDSTFSNDAVCAGRKQ